MKKNILILLLLGSMSYLQAQVVKGLVFEDLNQNGHWDDHEPCLSKVHVSDGYHVSETDVEGNFAFNSQPGARFIFVTTPSGYKPLSRHYRPIQANTDNYLFPLIKDSRQSKDKTKLLQITDSETTTKGTWVENLKNYAANNAISLLLHTGDICYEPGMEMHAKYVNSVQMNLPTYYSIGNHDLVKGEYGEKMFEDLFGPTYYSFESGPAYVVVTPMPIGDHTPKYTKDQVIRWLKKDLALKDPTKPLIFINHNYIADPDFVIKGDNETIDLKSYNLKAWLYGHWHNNYIYQRHGAYVVCSAPPHKGGIDNASGQFLSIEIGPQGITDIRPVYSNLSNHIELIAPSNGNEKRQPIDVVAYDSERSIQSVSAITTRDAKQKKKDTIALSPQGDWHWKGDLSATANFIHTVDIIVKYTNGETETRQYTLNATSKLEKLWSTTVDASIWRSKPLVTKNKLYFGTMDDGIGKPVGVYALDKASGKVLWHSPSLNSIKNELHLNDDKLLATDVEGNAYALNPTNGQLLWKNAVSHPTIPAFVTGPIMDHQYYYTGTGTTYRQITIDQGKTQWTSTGTQGGEASPASMSLFEDKLFVGVNWNALYALDAKNGDVIWKNNDRPLIFRSAAISIDTDTLYAVGSASIYKFNPKDGTVLQQKETTDNLNVMGAPLVMKDLLIVGTGTSGVTAYDRHTLTEKWKFRTGNALVYTSPYTGPDQSPQIATVEPAILKYKDKLYVGASDGFLYVLSVDGQLLEKVNVGAPIFADAVIVDNHLYIADFSGTITCLKL